MINAYHPQYPTHTFSLSLSFKHWLDITGLWKTVQYKASVSWSTVLSPDRVEGSLAVWSLHVSSLISPMKAASVLWKTGHQGEYSLNLTLWGGGQWDYIQVYKPSLHKKREGGPASTVMRSPSDLVCESNTNGPTKYPLKLQCIYESELVSVAALKHWDSS